MSSCPQLKHALPTMQSMLLNQACIVRCMKTDTLGKRIEYALAQSKKSPADASKACHVTAQAVYSWIRDEIKNLRSEHLFELADLTQFEAKWIATGNGPERPAGKMDAKKEEILRAMEDMPDYMVDKVSDDIKSLKRVADHIKNNGTSG
jgi:hypothetical protein